MEWWEAWLVVAITINTTINAIVFFKGRKVFKKDKPTSSSSTS